MQLNGYTRTAEALVELGRRFELSIAPINEDECKTLEELYQLGFGQSRQLQLFGIKHIDLCPRCNSWFDSFAAIRAIEHLPRSWDVVLAPPEMDGQTSFVQHLGKISLRTRQFESVENEITWRPSPMNMRLNLVVDSALGLACFTLLEVPTEVESITVRIHEQQLQMQSVEPSGTFEVVIEDDEEIIDLNGNPFSSLINGFLAEPIAIEFKLKGEVRSNRRPVVQLLEEHGVLEHEYDYLLPGGYACKTHVNVAKVCHDEFLLDRLAEEFDTLLFDDLTVIVANSWATAMLARRVVRRRNVRAGVACVVDVLCEGYPYPVLTDAIPAGATVGIITDVVVSGTQVSRIRHAVRRVGGTVLSVAALAVPVDTAIPSGVEYVFKYDLGICSEEELDGDRERMHFNPLANAMTFKRHVGRSPEQFLTECPEANDLWKFLSRVEQHPDGIGVYKRHFVEGDTHYTQFVDTGRILKHSEFGPEIIERIRDHLAARHVVPDVLMFPKRRRAELFAERLRDSFDVATSGSLELVSVRCGGDRRWHFPPDTRDKLRDKFVLIVDTGIGHGKTIDLFGMAAAELGAAGIGVAVILSRLPESAEKAFSDRFSGGFLRLFNLPVRPVVVRGTPRENCPYCQRKMALSYAATETQSEAIQKLASFRRRIVPTGEANPTRTIQSVQRTLFEATSSSPFLESCTPRVAGGVALHSLYAAQNNGMASLSLRELTDERLPVKTREAMVADLPIGAVAWSQGVLDQELFASLKEIDSPSVWSAAAVALASEHYTGWFQELRPLLSRASRLRHSENPQFWQRLAFSAFMAAKDLGEFDGESLRSEIKSMECTYRDTEAGKGLSSVLEAIESASVDSSQETGNEFNKKVPN